MIGGDFTNFGNNRLKLTQFSHTLEVTLFSNTLPQHLNSTADV